MEIDTYQTADLFDNDQTKDLLGGADETTGTHSSTDLGKLKNMLSIKMDTPAAHYTHIHLIGAGSFGEVHSAHDTLLGRDVAVKTLKERFRDDQEVIDRFLKEARGSAQLEHPNIIPVHEIGAMDDLGIYFTMKKIEGETLKDVLDQLDAGSLEYQKKYPRMVLLGIFLAVCNGVAFAHSRGVIHRDLKPANIILGDFGEVMILDWGLVKHLGGKEEEQSKIQLRMDEFDVGSRTIDGAISGTPNYMPPEQASGNIDEIDFQSDVYSLGAILYHMLAFVPPFEKTQLRKLLENVKNGVFEAPRKRRPQLKIPRELDGVCLKALEGNKVRRYASVEALAKDIRNFMGNFEVSAYRASKWVRAWRWCKRHPVKSSVAAAVCIALSLNMAIFKMMVYSRYVTRITTAQEVRAVGDSALEQAKTTFVKLEKASEEFLQEKSSEELALEQQLAGQIAEMEENYSLALILYRGVPELYQRRDSVLDGYRGIMINRIEFALFRNDFVQALQWVKVVREWAGSSITDETELYLAEVIKKIEGKGRLSMTAPEGVREAILYPLGDDDGRLVLMDPIMKSQLPRTLNQIPHGSYVLSVKTETMGRLNFPVQIQHGEDVSLDLVFPPSVPEGMLYVPAGPFTAGGDAARFNRKHQVTLPAFFIAKYEVTFAEYIQFWLSLKTEQERSDYLSLVKLEVGQRIPVPAWNEAGELLDERILPNYPVVGISQAAAVAYCQWLAQTTGRPIRLPSAMEWEKAARGVDGRTYVWGPGLDERLTLTKKNKKGKEEFPLWAPPGSFARDVSVYGAYDMAGNVREWTTSLFPDSHSLYEVKGGSASTPSHFLPCSYSSDTSVVPSDIGFRYVEDL